MNDRVSITIQDHVADVRLNRPDKMNALDPAMFEGIVAAGDAQTAKAGAITLERGGNAIDAAIAASMAAASNINGEATIST